MIEPKTILLIDDDRLWLTEMKERLETDGYRVNLTAHGSMVIRLIYEECPDLIMSGVDMPECDGSQVFALLDGDDRGKDIPLMFLSSLVTPAEAAEGSFIGPHAVISKKTPFWEILTIVRREIGEPVRS